MSSHTGEWSLDASSHSLAWSISKITSSDNSRSGSSVFTVNGDDAGLFFPVKVNFVGQGSVAGINVASTTTADTGEEAPFSVDAHVTAESYQVV